MYKLPKEMRDAILTYFGTRPYNEVIAGVRALESLEKITENEEKRNE